METKNFRAVLDINIYLAAYLSKNPNSPTAELLRRWRRGEFSVLYSDSILHDIIRKFEEKGLSPRYAIALVSDLKSIGEYVAVSLSDIIPVIIDDPDDDSIVACALKGDATHLVTYDPHFDCLGNEYQKVRITDGLHFLYEVRGEIKKK